ncbi:hypothetical protein HNR78_003455 [Parageobacillus toebii NBRC 107807]|uniref:Uncharacterized protein n=1 Tax=Parageobacillus toebii NBRC 107807 TaxID=1223503 RepID=A0AA89T5U0_9BACL|nr:hypothetical protein [Parageobacillus toebii NBRC 107807]
MVQLILKFNMDTNYIPVNLVYQYIQQDYQ